MCPPAKTIVVVKIFFAKPLICDCKITEERGKKNYWAVEAANADGTRKKKLLPARACACGKIHDQAQQKKKKKPALLASARMRAWFFFYYKPANQLDCAITQSPERQHGGRCGQWHVPSSLWKLQVTVSGLEMSTAASSANWAVQMAKATGSMTGCCSAPVTLPERYEVADSRACVRRR